MQGRDRVENQAVRNTMSNAAQMCDPKWRLHVLYVVRGASGVSLYKCLDTTSDTTV